MRHVIVNVDGKTVHSNVSHNAQPFIEIMVDEQQVVVGEIPKVVCPDEPEEFGSQVLARISNLHSPITFTKTDTDKWTGVYSTDTQGKSYAYVKHWSALAVLRVIRPVPPAEVLEEPKGVGAIVETDCHAGCTKDSHFVRVQGIWTCNACGCRYKWANLIEDSPEVNIVSQGTVV